MNDILVGAVTVICTKIGYCDVAIKSGTHGR